MTIKPLQNVNRNMTITSMDGKKFYLLEVIAFVLKYLKHKLQGIFPKCSNHLRVTNLTG